MMIVHISYQACTKYIPKVGTLLTSFKIHMYEMNPICAKNFEGYVCNISFSSIKTKDCIEGKKQFIPSPQTKNSFTVLISL